MISQETNLGGHGVPFFGATPVKGAIEEVGKNVQEDVHSTDANEGPIASFICDSDISVKDKKHSQMDDEHNGLSSSRYTFAEIMAPACTNML